MRIYYINKNGGPRVLIFGGLRHVGGGILCINKILSVVGSGGYYIDKIISEVDRGRGYNIRKI